MIVEATAVVALGPFRSGGMYMEGERAVARGCLFCRSGKEGEIVRRFAMAFPDGRAIAPTRTRYRRTRESVFEERVPLLPGYVFFELDDAGEKMESVPYTGDREGVDALQSALLTFSRADGVLKLLRYTNGNWRLHGFDDQFAKMLFETDGNIGISQAYFDTGRRIRILNGFLKDHEGNITRVNRKTKAVEVSVDLQGKKVSMWLGYELVEALPDEAGRA